MTTSLPERVACGLPEYDGLIADVWRDYLASLVGYVDVDRWARLPATFRWHELWERLDAAIRASSPALPVVDEDEAYELVKRDGYEEAVAHIDRLTGGDGEYFASTIPGRGCPDHQTMTAGIVERFEAIRSQPVGGERPSAREILNAHCEYMDGLDRGQRWIGMDQALRAVEAALSLPAIAKSTGSPESTGQEPGTTETTVRLRYATDPTRRADTSEQAFGPAGCDGPVDALSPARSVPTREEARAVVNHQVAAVMTGFSFLTLTTEESLEARLRLCAHGVADAILSLIEARPEGDGLTPRDAWQDLVDKDDRTSPEEYPDMALITFEELADYMRAAIPPLPAPSSEVGNG